MGKSGSTRHLGTSKVTSGNARSAVALKSPMVMTVAIVTRTAGSASCNLNYNKPLRRLLVCPDLHLHALALTLPPDPSPFLLTPHPAALSCYVISLLLQFRGRCSLHSSRTVGSLCVGVVSPEPQALFLFMSKAPERPCQEAVSGWPASIWGMCLALSSPEPSNLSAEASVSNAPAPRLLSLPGCGQDLEREGHLSSFAWDYTPSKKEGASTWSKKYFSWPR